MTEYAFPEDLLETIKSRARSAPDALFSLPEDYILQCLLETCYHASLRTSEHRRVECIVAYAPIADFQEGVLSLCKPLVPLTDDELVRLAPATERHQTVIACDEMDGGLHIWGFFELGHLSGQYSAGEPPKVPIRYADFLPDYLTITIERPGSLSIARGQTGLVRLRDGRLLLPQENPLMSLHNPLGSSIQRLIDEVLRSSRYSDSLSSDKTNDRRLSLLNVYTTSILAILDHIRLKRHGGSVVIAPNPLGEHIARMTYAVSEKHGLIDEMVSIQALNDLQPVAHPDLHREDEWQQCQAELALRRSSQHLVRGISRISRLAAVDGAVILDGRLRIEGFGVQFPVLLSPGTTVTNAQTGHEYPCTQWGLRHQSIFAVCHDCEDAIGLIVSQDGNVKAVKAVNGTVFFWDGILD